MLSYLHFWLLYAHTSDLLSLKTIASVLLGAKDSLEYPPTCLVIQTDSQMIAHHHPL